MKKFTLIEVVVALAILVLSLAGLLQLLSSSQEKIGSSIEHWNHTHILMQAAEYALLQEGKDDKLEIPQEIFDYPDYTPIITFNEVDEQLPDDFKDQQGQVPLIGVKIEIVREKDKKTVSEITVDRFDYEENAP
ncbi:MAG: hypothetical protein E7040_04835 [Lentisphaerae bacterium]|nr:hypothetical protein [Lentisphaerota bacterium]